MEGPKALFLWNSAIASTKNALSILKKAPQSRRSSSLRADDHASCIREDIVTATLHLEKALMLVRELTKYDE